VGGLQVSQENEDRGQHGKYSEEFAVAGRQRMRGSCRVRGIRGQEQVGRRIGLDLIFGSTHAANGLGKNSDEGKESGPRRNRPLEEKITL